MPNPHSRGQATSTIVGAARLLRRRQTAAEASLWQALRGSGLAGLKFRRQHPYGAYILDFFCVERRLCVEVDGGAHLDPEQALSDRARDAYLQGEGITVLRVGNRQVLADLSGVLRRIAAAAASPLS